MKRESAAFKQWFAGSKIVDRRDKPMLMWHGTTKKFSRFDKSFLSPSGAFGSGFYFTNDYELAKLYSNGGEPIAAYLSIKRPWTQHRDKPYGSAKHPSFHGMSGHLEERGYDGVLVIEREYREVVALHPEQITIIRP